MAHHAGPGRLVSVGTHRLHAQVRGSGEPTVVFDAALGASSLSWSLVQPALAGMTRTVAYDRAGFGWSDAGPLPRTAGRIAGELHLLLDNAGLGGPYVLVGHSFGGLVMRLFAARHRRDVAAVVLIEPAIEEQWREPGAEEQAMIARGDRLCRYGSTAARLGLARVVAALVSIGALGAARALVRVVSRGGLGRSDEGILAPIWKLPAEARRPLRRFWTERRFFDALGSQIRSICESADEVARETAARPIDYPLTVITAAASTARRIAADRALAAAAPQGRHVLVEGSGHWVPLDAPQAVIEVIGEVVRECRRQLSAGHAPPVEPG